MSETLSTSTGALRDDYQTVVIGSGYGGALKTLKKELEG